MIEHFSFGLYRALQAATQYKTCAPSFGVLKGCTFSKKRIFSSREAGRFARVAQPPAMRQYGLEGYYTSGKMFSKRQSAALPKR